jgi:predicted ArsR family transcriptional regulator
VARYYRARITATEPKKRLQQFAAILEQEGGLVEFAAEGGQVRITKRTCAFINMFDDQRHGCAIDLKLISAIAGCPVRQIACHEDGAPCCQFAIDARPAKRASKVKSSRGRRSRP